MFRQRKPWPNANYFLLFNHTDTGYTVDTIDQYNEEHEYDYNLMKDIRGNAFALRIREDGAIGYRYGILDCETENMYNVVEEYSKTIGIENILVYPIGRKVADAVKKMKITPMGDYQHMSGKPNYNEASDLAGELIERYINDEIQEVVLLYNHFKSSSTQVLTRETYLPIDLSTEEKKSEKQEKGTGMNILPDYIIEPSVEKVIQKLLPKVLHMKIYTVLLDSAAAEHAARTVAMQVATDNANELLKDLTVQYNKTRQQAITNELLDIVGGTMA